MSRRGGQSTTPKPDVNETFRQELERALAAIRASIASNDAKSSSQAKKSAWLIG